MRNPVIRVALGVGALILGGLVAGTTATADAAASQHTNQSWHSVRVCGATGSPRIARCDAVKLVRDGTRPGGNGHGGGGGGGTGGVSGQPSGMTAQNLESAYHVAGLTSGARTVAVVDAYGYPNLESDLAVYRQTMQLSPCTIASGCLTIVNQSGGTSLPRFNSGWAGEQALDVDAVSAICPDCHILVVQASSASIANLGAGVEQAAKMKATAISNSYGGGDLSDATYGSYYNHPGIAVTASTGDNGYQGASFPASSSYVTAVGGTSLKAASNARGWAETAWSGSGSGCSTVNAALAVASTFNTGCSKRAMADVAAAADPNNGGMAVVFPSTSTSSSWTQVGGTSEASPIIASVYALSGNTSGSANAIPYAATAGLNDVTTGNNGTCPTTQWCTARTGWDGPTGLGTPNGAGAF